MPTGLLAHVTNQTRGALCVGNLGSRGSFTSLADMRMEEEEGSSSFEMQGLESRIVSGCLLGKGNGSEVFPTLVRLLCLVTLALARMSSHLIDYRGRHGRVESCHLLVLLST